MRGGKKTGKVITSLKGHFTGTGNGREKSVPKGEDRIVHRGAKGNHGDGKCAKTLGRQNGTTNKWVTSGVLGGKGP